MSNTIQSVRGFNDLLPGQIASWRHAEQVIASVLDRFGYREIRLPLLEKTELFARTIGEVTDIVEKEMYSFDDRNGESLSLRPEGTAGCVRACMQHGLLYNQQPRLWYQGPMFRHERPQKGRLRQFHQVGVEVFGLEGPDVDAELILMTRHMLDELGIDGVRLEINTLGTSEARTRYRDALVEYLAAREGELDEDSRRRLSRNPLRILDSKDASTRMVLEDAPRLEGFLDPPSAEHFAALRRLLDTAGIAYTVNPHLVRGLDYYGRTVFEWITDRLGAQGTVCAGGRYDALVEQLGGPSTPAVGFALGLERIVALLEEQAGDHPSPGPDIYLMVDHGARSGPGLVLADRIRRTLPGANVFMHCGGGSFKRQFKRADRSGARWALVLGEQEAMEGRVGIKDLRGGREQYTVAQADLIGELSKLFGG